MHLYISGPMRGRPNLNKASFDFYESRLTELGHTVFNPWAADSDQGVECQSRYSADDLYGYIQRDLSAITVSDGVFLMPGWQNSRGAAVERMFAHYLGKPVVDYRGHEWRFGMNQPAPMSLLAGDAVPIIALPPSWTFPDTYAARLAAGVV